MRTPLSRRRFVLAAATTAVATSAASACGTTTQGSGGAQQTIAKDDLILVLSVINTTNPYMASMIQGAEALSKELGVPLRIVDSAGSSQQEISQIQAILAEGKKVALVSNTVASADAVPIVNAVKAAGGYAVIWWNKPDDFTPEQVGDNFVSFQMHSGVDAGMCTGKALAESLGGEGNIIAFPGVLDSTVSQQRVAGLKEALKEFPGITILEERPANWDQQVGFKEAQAMIAKYGNQINGVWTADDAMMLGAIQAFDNAGTTADVKFAGEGLYPPVIELMQKPGSTIVGETFHRGYMAAAIGLLTAYQAATGVLDVAKMPAEQRQALFKIGCVTPENLDEFTGYDNDVPGWIKTLVKDGPYNTEPVPVVAAGPVKLP
ncbi:sugar ABC transporter substrate-binding protein [Kineococcus gynurae]|uniref:Sugar ABC transporter substrate-binding protein n=1 Tax=Kineococcus gynurae TaxID=452979 RepID=A0ABV5LPC2_9ACTN